jgi:antitoxin (DNA-binding transcriptional repressor) of toxin-antitoxin stability system
MSAVNISELKDNLSHYLRRVRRGETILVRDRDRVIARIEPAGPADSGAAGDEAWLDELERRGALHRGRGGLPVDWLEGRPAVAADVVAALLSDREEGR